MNIQPRLYHLYDLILMSDEPQALSAATGDVVHEDLWELKSGAVEAPDRGCVHDVFDFDGVKRLQVWHAEPEVVVVRYDKTRVKWDRSRRLITLAQSSSLKLPAAVLLERVVAPMAFMLLRPNRIALHASAVSDREGGAWVFIGNSGAGKSTTALELMRRGMPLLADDLVLLDTTSTEVIAATPSLRLFDPPASVPEALQNQAITPGAQKYWYQLPDRREQQSRYKLRGIFCLGPQGEPVAPWIVPLQGAAATAHILAQAFDLTQGTPRFRARRFQALCSLSRSSPILKVTYHLGDRAEPDQVMAILEYLDGRAAL